MSLSLRVFLCIALLALSAGYTLFTVYRGHINPLLQQATEDTLVDTANALAPIASADLRSDHIANGQLATAFTEMQARKFNARIWSQLKTSADLQIYVTDAHGVVVYDSQHRAEGKDYSRWNDVWQTLHGEYGRRATRENANDATSSVLHVAAPLKDNGRLIGVISVAKPVASQWAFVELAEGIVVQRMLYIVIAALLLAVLFSWWLSRHLRELVNYANAVSAHRRAELPPMPSGELQTLATAMARMHVELAGKAYIEHYVQALTHELKSPLAAIRASAELLEDDLPAPERERFIVNIQNQGQRAQQLIERLLELVRLEQRQSLEQPVNINLNQLWNNALADSASRIEQKQLVVSTHIHQNLMVCGDAFLLRQALTNLLDNAIDFSPQNGTLTLTALQEGSRISIQLRDQGAGIPEYAASRIFDRFYSLPRADGSKGTGLGLPFVREIAALHQGQVAVTNALEGGTVATLDLPAIRV